MGRVHDISDDGVLWHEPSWSSRAAFRELLRPALWASLRAWGVLMPMGSLFAEILIAANSYQAGHPMPLGLTLITFAFGVFLVPVAMAIELAMCWLLGPLVGVNPRVVHFSRTGWKWLPQEQLCRASFQRDEEHGDMLVLERSTPSAMTRRVVGIPATADLEAIKRVVLQWDCNRVWAPDQQPPAPAERASS